MRIALFTDGIYPYVVGGMQKHSIELAKALAEQGITIDLFHFIPENTTIKTAHAQLFAPYKNLHFHEVKFPSGPRYPGHYVKKSKLYSKLLFNALKQLPKPDFVYAQGFTGWYYGKQRKHDKLLAPLGVNLHGLNMFQSSYGLKSKIEQVLLRIPAKNCINTGDLIFSLGGKLTDIISSINNRVPVVNVPVGISPEWITEKTPVRNRPMRFVFVGRNDPVKALPVLLHAIKTLSAQRSDFYVDLVGIEKNETGFQSERICYHGSITNENELKKIYDAGDVLLCPSYSEGMPVVILEAMSRKLAVIASRTGAIEEQVSAGNGWLITPGNENELVNAMTMALNADDELVLRMKSDSGHKVQREFLWSGVAQKTIASIRSFIDSSAR